MRWEVSNIGFTNAGKYKSSEETSRGYSTDGELCMRAAALALPLSQALCWREEQYVVLAVW